MSDDTSPALEPAEGWVRWLCKLAVLLGAIALLATTLEPAVLVEPAAAQATPTPDGNISDTAPYYSDDNASVENDSWSANRTDPTLANVTYWVVTGGGWIVGTGDVAPGGAGLTGSLVLGLVVGGVLLGPVSRERVGPVAGGVLLVTALFGISAAALAPSWLWAVVLFIVGLLFTVVIDRALD